MHHGVSMTLISLDEANQHKLVECTIESLIDFIFIFRRGQTAFKRGFSGMLILIL